MTISFCIYDAQMNQKDWIEWEHHIYTPGSDIAPPTGETEPDRKHSHIRNEGSQKKERMERTFTIASGEEKKQTEDPRKLTPHFGLRI